MSSDILCGETPHSDIKALSRSVADRSASGTEENTGVDEAGRSVDFGRESGGLALRSSGVDLAFEDTALVSYPASQSKMKASHDFSYLLKHRLRCDCPSCCMPEPSSPLECTTNWVLLLSAGHVFIFRTCRDRSVSFTAGTIPRG